MDSFPIDALPLTRAAIFVCSTTGQGETPDNMKLLWTFLRRSDLAPNSLTNLHFTVFGLGDSSYPLYNAVARRLHQRLLSLGAVSFCPLGLGDDQHLIGYDGALIPWTDDAIKGLDTLPGLSKRTSAAASFTQPIDAAMPATSSTGSNEPPSWLSDPQLEVRVISFSDATDARDAASAAAAAAVAVGASSSIDECPPLPLFVPSQSLLARAEAGAAVFSALTRDSTPTLVRTPAAAQESSAHTLLAAWEPTQADAVSDSAAALALRPAPGCRLAAAAAAATDADADRGPTYSFASLPSATLLATAPSPAPAPAAAVAAAHGSSGASATAVAATAAAAIAARALEGGADWAYEVSVLTWLQQQHGHGTIDSFPASVNAPSMELIARGPANPSAALPFPAFITDNTRISADAPRSTPAAAAATATVPLNAAPEPAPAPAGTPVSAAEAAAEASAPPVAAVRRLAQAPLRGKDVRHISFDLSPSLCSRAPWFSPQQAALARCYGVGDVVEVFAPNNDGAVIAFLKRFGLKADDIICIDPVLTSQETAHGSAVSDYAQLPALRPGSEDTRGLPRRSAAWELATWYLDLAASPQRSFFDVLRECTTSATERDRLDELTSLAWAAELDRYCARERRTLTEVLDDFPCVRLPLEAALELLPRLAPRSYSIASSSAFLRSPYAQYFPPVAAPTPASAQARDIADLNPLQPPSAFPLSPCSYPALVPAASAAAAGVPSTLPQALLSRELWEAAQAVDEDAASAVQNARDAQDAAAGTPNGTSGVWAAPVPRADICVSIVEFRTPFKRLRRGHCTSFLAQAFSSSQPSALPLAARRLWVRIKPGALGAVPLDRPLLGLGPGTGIAPLLALAQLRLRAALGSLHALLAVEGLAGEDPEWAAEVAAALAPAALKTLPLPGQSGATGGTVVLGASSVSRSRLNSVFTPFTTNTENAHASSLGDVGSLADQLQQLASLAPLTLLFGCQRAGADHLYRDFFAAAARLGAVDRYESCFSRDNGMGVVASIELQGELAAEAALRGDKYVQHRLTRGEVARTANQTVLEQGVVIIAGSAKKMPKDIRRALEALLAALNNCSEESAGRMVAQMISQARYILDCWS